MGFRGTVRFLSFFVAVVFAVGVGLVSLGGGYVFFSVFGWGGRVGFFVNFGGKEEIKIYLGWF